MPLPSDTRAKWPPEPWRPILGDISEAAAWYAGDTDALARLYGTRPNHNQRVRFWATNRQRDANGNLIRKKLHAPAAADVAMVSANLLFGGEAALTVAEAHEENAEADAKAAQERLDEISERAGLANTLLEAAEICSGLGGVYLRPWWNRDIADHPWLDVVHPDHAIPTFSGPKLTEVTFWRQLTVDKGSAVWRHLEHHAPGRIEHALYVGDKDHLGIRVDLSRHEETAGLAVDEDGLIALPDTITGLATRYVPNMLPNRRRRGMRVGRADTAGTEDLMDALDETWTSWIRDIRVGQARLVVASEMLQRAGRGKGASFDLEQEVFTPLEFDPTAEGAKSITPVEFKIRTEEHAATVEALFKQIVSTAGYSQQTFGLDGNDNVVTATEVRARQARTQDTLEAKRRYWAPEVADVVQAMLAIDAEFFDGKVEPFRPRVDFDEGVVEDPKVTAETIELLNRAEAISIETRVRMAQPELGPEEVAAEVARIRAETGQMVDDPTGGVP